MAEHNSENVEKAFQIIESMKIEEFLQLQAKMQKAWGISDADLVASSSAPQAVETAQEDEEATYNLVATAMKDPSKKIKCTIFLKNIFKLDMQKCKEILENIATKPVIQQNISKEDAEKFIKEAASEDIQLVLERMKA